MAERYPDDAVVVIRGGLHSLDPDKVVDDATDSFLRSGYYAISTLAALDGDIAAPVPAGAAAGVTRSRSDLGGRGRPPSGGWLRPVGYAAR